MDAIGVPPSLQQSYLEVDRRGELSLYGSKVMGKLIVFENA